MNWKEDGKDVAKDYAATKLALGRTERELSELKNAQYEMMERQEAENQRRMEFEEDMQSQQEINAEKQRVTILLSTKEGQKQLKIQYKKKIDSILEHVEKYDEQDIETLVEAIELSLLYMDLVEAGKQVDFISFISKNKKNIHSKILLDEICLELDRYTKINNNEIWNKECGRLTKLMEKLVKNIDPLTSDLKKELPKFRGIVEEYNKEKEIINTLPSLDANFNNLTVLFAFKTDRIYDSYKFKRWVKFHKLDEKKIKELFPEKKNIFAMSNTFNFKKYNEIMNDNLLSFVWVLFKALMIVSICYFWVIYPLILTYRFYEYKEVKIRLLENLK